MTKKQPKVVPPLMVNGEVIRDGTPSICCHMLDYVLDQEKPAARTGLFRPLLTFEHAPQNKLKQRDSSRDVIYRATGRKAQNVFLVFCPFCGEEFNPKPNGKAKKSTKSEAAERGRPARPRQLQAG